MNSTRSKPWETNNNNSDATISTINNNLRPSNQFDTINNSNNNNILDDTNSRVPTTTTNTNSNTSNLNNELSNSPPLPPPLSDETTNANSNIYEANSASNGNNMYANNMYANNTYGSSLNSGIYGGSMYGNSLYGNNMYNNNMGMGMGLGMGMNSMYGMNGMYGNNGLFNRYGTNSATNNGNGIDSGMGSITESTLATFQLLENLINVINCFTQMLESSYMATYNSFFTLMTFTEEINRFKEFLGSSMGIFSIFKLLKKFKRIKSIGSTAKMNGSDSSTQNKNGLVDEFKNFTQQTSTSKIKRQKLSWKPIIIFLLGVFGFPYVLNKIIRRIHLTQKERILQLRDQQQQITQNSNDSNNLNNVNLNDLEFARALYDFMPENPNIEIKINKGELMAIISKKDLMGSESQWWRVRTRTGEMGYIPSNYIEIIKKKKKDV